MHRLTIALAAAGLFAALSAAALAEVPFPNRPTGCEGLAGPAKSYCNSTVQPDYDEARVIWPHVPDSVKLMCSHAAYYSGIAQCLRNSWSPELEHQTFNRW